MRSVEVSAPEAQVLKSSRRRILEVGALASVLALAAFTRFAPSPEVLGWYSDEGTNLDIALNLLEGEGFRYLALKDSTLLAARLPLFPALLAAVVPFTGDGMVALRTLTAGLGVMTVGLLILLVRSLSDRPSLALLAGAALAVYPVAAFYNRLGFSYNLLAPLVLLSALGLANYLGHRGTHWLLVGGLALGLGGVTDLAAFLFLPGFLLAASFGGLRRVPAAALASLVPVGVFAIWMMNTSPEALRFDLSFTFSRVGSLPLPAALAVIPVNYAALVREDLWFAIAGFGLFLLKPEKLRRLALLLYLPALALLMMVVRPVPPSVYYLIPFFPWVALGAAALVSSVAPAAAEALASLLEAAFESWGWRPNHGLTGWLGRRMVAVGTALGLFLVFAAPVLVWSLEARLGFRPAPEAAISSLLVNPEDALAAASFVNRSAGRGEVVVASPAVAWLIESNAADFQQALAADGRPTRHFPVRIPEGRWAFDPRFSEARFVIVDNIWWVWGKPNIPSLAEWMDEISAWPRVFRSGDVEVYENPER